MVRHDKGNSIKYSDKCQRPHLYAIVEASRSLWLCFAVLLDRRRTQSSRIKQKDDEEKDDEGSVQQPFKSFFFAVRISSGNLEIDFLEAPIYCKIQILLFVKWKLQIFTLIKCFFSLASMRKIGGSIYRYYDFHNRSKLGDLCSPESFRDFRRLSSLTVSLTSSYRSPMDGPSVSYSRHCAMCAPGPWVMGHEPVWFGICVGYGMAEIWNE